MTKKTKSAPVSSKVTANRNGKSVQLTVISKASPRVLSERAKERLIVKSRTKARKLARSMLRKWNARLDINEVDSIVDLSLCEAASRYSPDLGASFMTFLFYHLRGNLIRSISTSAQSNLVPLLDGDPSSPEELEDLQEIFKGANAHDIAEALNGTDVARPDEILMQKEMIELSQQAKTKLDSLARQVLDRVYVAEEQLIDIAAELGYSRCHMSRVKRRALETLYEEIREPLSLEKSRPTFEDEDSGPKKPQRGEVLRRKPRSKASIGAEKRVVNG